MPITLGTLNIYTATEHLELLAPRVADALSGIADTSKVGVAEIDPELSDTAAFCEHYKVDPTLAANCVVLEAKRADRKWFVACVVPGNAHADVNGLVKKTVNARKVSFAKMDDAVAATEMEYGAITPIGLPQDWTIFIDKAIADADYVIVGSGIRKSKLAVPGPVLASLPNARVLEGLGQTQ